MPEYAVFIEYDWGCLDRFYFLRHDFTLAAIALELDGEFKEINGLHCFERIMLWTLDI